MEHPTPAVPFVLGGRSLGLRATYESLRVIKEKTGIYLPVHFSRLRRANDEAREKMSIEFEEALLEHLPLFLWAVTEAQDGQAKPDLAWFEQHLAFPDIPAAQEALLQAMRLPNSEPQGNGSGEAKQTATLSTSPASGESTSSS